MSKRAALLSAMLLARRGGRGLRRGYGRTALHRRRCFRPRRAGADPSRRAAVAAAPVSASHVAPPFFHRPGHAPSPRLRGPPHPGSPTAPVPGSFTSSGGTVNASCLSGQVRLTSWIPAQGYQTDGYARGPSTASWVVFRSSATDLTITATCAGGQSAVHHRSRRPGQAAERTGPAERIRHGGGGGPGGGGIDSGGSGGGGSGHGGNSIPRWPWPTGRGGSALRAGP